MSHGWCLFGCFFSFPFFLCRMGIIFAEYSMLSPLTWMPGRCVAIRVRRAFANEPLPTTCVINARHPRSWCVGGTSAKMRLPQSADTTSLTRVVSSWRGRASASRCRHWLLQMVPHLLLLRWARPLPPGDGEDSGDAASDAARCHSTPLSPETEDEMEAEPAPPPAAGPSTDGVCQRRRWKQGVLAAEDRLVVRMDRSANLCAPSRGSSDAALRVRYRVSLVDVVETYDARRQGGAFPANLLKTNFEFRSLCEATAEQRLP